MLVFLPIMMRPSSPLRTAPNQMLEPSPIITFPMIVAVGATNTSLAIDGTLPLYSRIIWPSLGSRELDTKRRYAKLQLSRRVIHQAPLSIAAVKKRTDLFFKNTAKLCYRIPAFVVGGDQSGVLQLAQQPRGPGDIPLIRNCRFRQRHSGPDAKHQRPGGPLYVVNPAAGFDREVSGADTLDIGLDSVKVGPRKRIPEERAPAMRISRHPHSQQSRPQAGPDVLELIANRVLPDEAAAGAGDVAHAFHSFSYQQSLAHAFERTRDFERRAIVTREPCSLWPEPQYVPGHLGRLEVLDAVEIIQHMFLGLIRQVLDHVYVDVIDQAAQNIQGLDRGLSGVTAGAAQQLGVERLDSYAQPIYSGGDEGCEFVAAIGSNGRQRAR